MVGGRLVGVGRVIDRDQSGSGRVGFAGRVGFGNRGRVGDGSL